MRKNKVARLLLLPPVAILFILVPVSVALLIASFLVWGTATVGSYIAYALSAYTLTVWCVRLPQLTRQLRAFQKENKYAKRWREDLRFRVTVALSLSLFFNIAYALLQLGLGIFHRTLWFGAFGIWYICLALMRLLLLLHIKGYAPSERMRTELQKYRICGWVFLFMNLSLSLIVFFMVYWNRTFIHHEITTIAMAAYTFASLTMALINIFKYRKYNSPVLTASKALSLAAALASMLTLESTMLTTFGGGTLSPLARQLMLGTTGAALCLLMIAMAAYMIVKSTKKLQ